MVDLPLTHGWSYGLGLRRSLPHGYGVEAGVEVAEPQLGVAVAELFDQAAHPQRPPGGPEPHRV